MNRLIPRTIRAAIGALTISALALGLAGPALAAHVLVSTTVPGGLRVGEIVNIPVVVEAPSGAPVGGLTVDSSVRASFFGVVDNIEFGPFVTNERGVADFVYRPRLAGHNELRMEFVAPGDGAVEVASVVVDVSDGGEFYPAVLGLDIPGLNVGLVMVVLTTVWLILFGVALVLVAIARSGCEERHAQ